MNFNIKHDRKDNTTFSDAGLYSFLTSPHEMLDKIIAITVHDGFTKRDPIKELDVEVNIKANNKEVDWDKLLELYPEHVSFNYRALAELIVEKGINEDGT